MADILLITTLPRPAVQTDDSEGVFSSSPVLDLEYAPPITTYSVRWNSSVVTDDEALPILFLTDDSHYVAPPAPSPPWRVLTVADDDAGAQLKNFGLDDETAPPLPVTTTAWLARVVADESEWVTSSAPTIVEDETAPPLPVWPANRLVLPTTDDEVFVSQTPSLVDEASASLPSLPMVRWVTPAVTDDDVLSFVIEEEYGAGLAIRWAQWTTATATDDEVLPVQAPFGLDDDPPFVARYTLWPVWRRVVIDENEGASLVNFFLDDEAEVSSRRMAIVWRPVVIGSDEGFINPGGPTPSPALVTALANQFIGSPQTIAIDATGASELRPILFDFRSDPVIQKQGDSLISPQTLVFSQEPPEGLPELALGGWTQVGNVAAITMSAPGSQVNAEYEVACRADTVQGNVIEKIVTVLIVGVGD